MNGSEIGRTGSFCGRLRRWCAAAAVAMIVVAGGGQVRGADAPAATDSAPTATKAPDSAPATKTVETPTATSGKGQLMKTEELRAGPVRLKFQDGELRYLYVNDKEIVRRIYFAVRDDTWQTPMPVFSAMDIKKTADAFKIHLAATCRSDKVDYFWTGDITGDPDGTITYKVTGEAAKDFHTNRISLCVLFGADSLAGQALDTVDAGGKILAGQFPEKVLPSSDLVAKDFRQLSYVTPDGMTVMLNLVPALFSMEDQRNWGDSSYKTYSMMYKNQDLTKGLRAGATLSLRVAKVKPPAMRVGPQGYAARVEIGKPIEGAKMPKILSATDSGGGIALGSFLDYNVKRDTVKAAKELRISYTPATHLPDDDTFMENRSALAEQLRTLKTFAPDAKVRVDFGAIVAKADDPRNTGKFAASWAVGALKYAMLGGAAEVCFKTDPVLLKELKEDSGLVPVAAAVAVSGRSPIEVVAFRDGGILCIMVANSTDSKQKILVEGLKVSKTAVVFPLIPTDKEVGRDESVAERGITLNLEPYEAWGIRIPASAAE